MIKAKSENETAIEIMDRMTWKEYHELIQLMLKKDLKTLYKK